MFLKGFSVTTIDFHKMFDNSFVIQLSFYRQNAS